MFLRTSKNCMASIREVTMTGIRFVSVCGEFMKSFVIRQGFSRGLNSSVGKIVLDLSM